MVSYMYVDDEIFVREQREKMVWDQSQNEHVIYTGLNLLQDKKPTSNVDLLISVEDKRIVVIHN
jgi:hypothetical protein